jgi:molecular chaperone DnaJ
MIGRPAAAARDGEGGEGVSKRDYYEVLGVSDRHRVGNQERVSQARDEVPSRRNPGDQRPKSKFKEAPKPTPSSPTREARMYDRFGHAGVRPPRRRVRPDGLHRLRGHSSAASATSSVRRSLRRPPARRSAARRRPALRPRDLIRGIGARRRDHDSDSPPGELRTCSGTGRGRVRRRRPVRSAEARAGPLSRVLHRRAHVPQCRGAARSSRSRAGRAGRGRVRRERKITVKIPRRHRHGTAAAAAGEGEAASAAVPPAISTCVITSRSTSSSGATASTCSARFRSTSRPLALGGEIHVPTLDGTETVKSARGHATGTTLRLRARDARRHRAADAAICSRPSRC